MSRAGCGMKPNMVVFTGAGISAESGLKTFRDSDGLWEQHRIEDVATPMAWEKNPRLVLEFYNQRRRDVLKAQPNPAHLALATLESHFNVTIITQNIDDLHERGGSSNVVHLHGEIIKSRSSINQELLYECRNDIQPGDLCEEGSQLRPHVVWFHEAVPMMDVAADIAAKADYFIVIGTSLQVYPAAGLLHYAPRYAKKFLVDPNIPDVASIQNLEIITATATEGVPVLVSRLLKEIILNDQ